jgi:stearoyl-CoA desaturase (delta-9 desaturase)
MLPEPRPADQRVQWRGAAPFIVCQFLPLLVFVTGVTTKAVVLCIALFVTRVFFITAGYHRYFAHRSYRLGRVSQFLMAVGGLTATQKGPLWWAGQHRAHHLYADTDADPHSPQRGFWWSHVGWILSGHYGATNYEVMDDFAKYPELRWLNEHDWIGPWALGFVCWLIAGWSGLIVGFFLSTVLLWHSTFCVNSVAHVWGTRRYATADTSRNNVIIAVLTLGEGWHNNHHHFPNSARQGFKWYEIDISYQVLRLLSLVGIVKDLRQPPEAAKAAKRIRAGNFDVGRFRQHLARASAVLPPEEDAGLRAELVETAARASRLARAGRVPTGS